MTRVPDQEPSDPTAVGTDWRFAPIPEALLYDHALDPLAVRVYGCLQRHGLTADTCYPSHARIARLIGCSKRSVQRPLRDLEDGGWVVRVPRFDQRGDRISDRYEVHSQRAPRAEQRGTPAPASAVPPRQPARTERESVEREQPERENPPCPAKADHAAEPDLFDAFWTAYPRRNGKRIGRADAARVWQRLTLTGQDAALAAVGHYAASCEGGGDIAMDAHRWLTKARWEDWAEPAEVQSPLRSGYDRSAWLKRPGHKPLAELVANAMNGHATALPEGGPE